MQSVGFVLLVGSLLATIYGILERRKTRRILTTPFRRTGEIAASPRVADAKGNVSCEGSVVPAAHTVAPCSGKPCLYYEIEVIQHWTKVVLTDKGPKEQGGQTTIDKEKFGVIFFVNDGSGAIGVDPREGMEIELERTFEQEQGISSGDAWFGQFHTHVPEAGPGKDGRSVRVIERIVPLHGNANVFVLGQLNEQRLIAKPRGLATSLLGSRRGRAELIHSTKHNATIALVAGAISFFPSAALTALGDSDPPPVMVAHTEAVASPAPPLLMVLPPPSPPAVDEPPPIVNPPKKQTKSKRKKSTAQR